MMKIINYSFPPRGFPLGLQFCLKAKEVLSFRLVNHFLKNHHHGAKIRVNTILNNEKVIWLGQIL